MNTWIQHLPILPIVIPMATGAAMLMLNDSQRRIRICLAAVSMLLQLAVALALLRLTAQTSSGPWLHGIGVYLLGGWSAPFGIVVVADQLSAIMLTLNAVLGLAVLVYSNARWDRAGAHFHPLFQFLAMGINGAFLTGDIFNLFVFFEVLLAASYGLMLHGSGRARVGAGLHYITVNLVASLLLLVAIALIYGVTGTLNMADLAVRAGLLNGPDRQLFEVGAAILGIAFLIKAAAWPLNFWLPATYANSCAPVAAIFAIMTKVGIYALLRLGSLLLPTQAPAAFSGAWMFPIGLGTLAFGTLGLLRTQQTPQLAAYCIIVSSGTLLAALGMPGVTLTGPALYYLISSVLAVGAFFLLTEMVERTQGFGASVLATSQDAFDIDDAQLSDHPDDIAGATIPAAMAFLGFAFILCTLLITGLPPLSGFVAKFALLSSILDMPGSPTPSVDAWLLLAGILISGMAAVIALARAGMRLFWISDDVTIPRLSVREAAPVTMLLGACVALTLWAGPATSYLESTAKSLNDPTMYIQAVFSQQPAAINSPSGVTP